MIAMTGAAHHGPSPLWPWLLIAWLFNLVARKSFPYPYKIYLHATIAASKVVMAVI
jgi:hypothetical protein